MALARTHCWAASAAAAAAATLTATATAADGACGGGGGRASGGHVAPPEGHLAAGSVSVLISSLWPSLRLIADCG